MRPSPALLALLLSGGLLFGAPSAHAQNEPTLPAVPPIEAPLDTLAGRQGVSISPKIYTPILWSPGAGFGIGVGAEIKNLGLAGSALTLQVAPALDRGQYGVWYSTQSAYGPGLSAMGGLFYEANENFPYFGVGPTSSEDNRLLLHRQLTEVEGRVSYGLGALGSLRVGTFARYQRHKGFEAREAGTPGALGRLDARSVASLSASQGDPTAVAAGAEVYYDTRTNLFNPVRGVLLQAGTMRTMSASGAPFADYWQRYATAHYFLPLSYESKLMLRGVLIDSDAQDGTPNVLLPVLDSDIGAGMQRHRFVANDVLYLSAEYSKTLLDLFGAVTIDGTLSGHLIGVYDELSQVRPAITLERLRVPDASGYPFRPAVGAGLRIYSYLLESTLLNIGLGFSRERLDVEFFNVVTDLRARRPSLRGR